MSLGLKEVSQVILFNKQTNEIIMAWGFNEKQNQADKLMKLRNKAKRKRLRKKLNTKIDRLLRG